MGASIIVQAFFWELCREVIKAEKTPDLMERLNERKIYNQSIKIMLGK